MSDKQKSHKIIGVRVTEQMADELNVLAEAEHRSVSAVIRLALDEYLNKYFEKKDV